MTATRARRLGVLLMVVALAGALVVFRPSSAGAQSTELNILSRALFAFAPTDAAPRILVSEVPPGVVCIVQPPACPEALDPLTKGTLTPALQLLLADAEPTPVEFVPPNEIAVAIHAGAQRYMTGLKFELPPVPSGEEVDSFIVTFEEGQPTYNFSSPFFRQAVLAAVAQAGDTGNFPDVFTEEFQKGLENEDDRFPPVDPETRLGIEVCPFTQPFEPSPAPTAASDDDIPRNEFEEFAIDCLRGTNGVFDAEAGTWSFDLTFAAQAWADGSLENHGVLFRNQAAENLAYGDVDLSSFYQTILIADGGSSEQESSPPPPPLQPLPPPPPLEPAPTQPPMVTPPSGGSAVPPPAPPAPPAEPQPPAVANPDPAPTPTAADPIAAEISSPWWWWLLLLLLFAAGWYLTQRSLNAEVVTVGTRDGALARLTNRSLDPPDLPTQV